MKPNLILIGAPGSGKGTQASRLVREFGYKHLSTGDLLRKEISEKSSLGLEVKSVMDSGRLVDDNLVLRLLKANAETKLSSNIFDGFPRNINQAKLLDQEILNNVNYKVIYFDISKEALFDRLCYRRTCPSCGKIYNIKLMPPKVSDVCDACGHHGLTHRSDDNEKVVNERLDVFLKSTGPLLKYYENKGNLYRVDANLDVDKIFETVVSRI